MIRLHILGIAHTISNKEFTVCAYTQKIVNMCKMFTQEGMHVIHYGHPDSDVVCAEHVNVIDRDTYNSHYGSMDWKTYGANGFDWNQDAYKVFNDNAVAEINKRKQPHDILLCPFGLAHKFVSDRIENIIVAEPCIGYTKPFAPYKVFESYAIMHAVNGYVDNNSYYDVVIPSGLEENDFEFRQEKEDFFLMCGRLQTSKGVHIASQVCEVLGKKLVLIGTTYGPQSCSLGQDWPDHVEYLGYADIEKRKYYMSRAKALFTPTTYTEPFGNVAIEALMCGTPVIASDWGAFTETVPHGIAGYRCRTFEQFLWATKNIDTISTANCRAWAQQNYSMKKVGKMYKEYFDSLIAISSASGWYEPNFSRTELDWLTKTYP